MPGVEPSVAINAEDLRRAREMLHYLDGGVNTALMRAVNDTVRGMRTDIGRSVRDRYTLKVKDAKRGLSVKLASIYKNDIEGHVESTGKPLSVARFSVTQRRGGVGIKILRTGQRHFFRSAFVTRVLARRPEGRKSTLVGNVQGDSYGGNDLTESRHVFIRVKASMIGLGLKTHNSGGEGPGRKRVGRLPIAKIFGPSVPAAVAQAEVNEPLMEKARDRLENRFWHHVHWLDEENRFNAFENAPVQTGFGNWNYILGD